MNEIFQKLTETAFAIKIEMEKIELSIASSRQTYMFLSKQFQDLEKTLTEMHAKLNKKEEISTETTEEEKEV